MTEGTLSAEELDELKALLKKPVHTVGDVYLSTELLAEAVPALIAEIEALKHDIGRHMDALLAADEAREELRQTLVHLDHDICHGIGDRDKWLSDIAAALKETSNG